MTSKCSNENCFPDTTCSLGHLDRTDCEHWQQESAEVDETAEHPEAPTSDVPWNGYALGTSDLTILSGRGQPVVVGLIGPPHSGKTSLLAYLYMWLLKYGKLGGWDVGGSWTLGAGSPWSSIVDGPENHPHRFLLILQVQGAIQECFMSLFGSESPEPFATSFSRMRPGNGSPSGHASLPIQRQLEHAG